MHDIRWDIFCRVIDNHGDLGVCLRLTRDLVQRGRWVRLWVDDASALDWMQAGPSTASEHGGHSITEGQLAILPWPTDATQLSQAWVSGNASRPAEPDVVIEAFGCDLPEACLKLMAHMATQSPAPRWINLEYLSAEDYVERSHGLQSPQFSGPARGLIKHFFYPGFTAKTGGLLRERDLAARQLAFDRHAWLRSQGIDTQPGERLVSLFSYPEVPLEALMEALSGQATRLLLCPGWAQQQAPHMLAAMQATGRAMTLRLQSLPYLSQVDYDHLLWSCDLNLVRGEDSFVRAQWAGRPMMWHIYPQDDGAHAGKLAAFLDRYMAGQSQEAASRQRLAWRAWNGLLDERDNVGSLTSIKTALTDWITHLDAPANSPTQAAVWRDQLLQQEDLCTQLISFVSGSAPESG